VTADVFADLVQAQRTSVGRWQARCPAHSPDKHPSLAISQGHSGVLLRCWAGCTTDAVVTALGLTLRDLFNDADTTPAERAKAAQQRQAHDAQAKALHHAAIERNRELLRLECLRDALGGLLARSPDDVEIARLFHGVLDRLHDAEAAMSCHEDGPLPSKPMPESPPWIHDALNQIFASETPRQHDPDAATFDELAAWLALQNSKEMARCKRAA
jgi:hypothetical protein